MAPQAIAGDVADPRHARARAPQAEPRRAVARVVRRRARDDRGLIGRVSTGRGTPANGAPSRFVETRLSRRRTAISRLVSVRLPESPMKRVAFVGFLIWLAATVG